MALWQTGDGKKCPSFMSTLDRHTHQLYLEYSALASLQRMHRQYIIEGVPASEDSTPGASATAARNSRKRRRAGSEGSDAGGEGYSDEGQLPRVDPTFKLDLVPAKPEPGTLVIGEPPQDIYTQSIAGMPLPPDSVQSRAAIKAMQHKIAESPALFFDLEGLSSEQVRGLTEYEWRRQLEREKNADGADRVLGPTGREVRDRRTKAQKLQDQQREELELEAEADILRRSFLDKARASNLAARASAGW